ncbi:MAG: S-layer homology domain-containing protein [Eubacteriales bacterium]|nr:S-layer homology domain-containing protein [Eubacteriales bacterium]
MRKSIQKRALSMLLALCMVVCMLPAAWAAGFQISVNGNDLEETYDSQSYAYVHTVAEDNAVVEITGTTTNHRVVVNADNVTIRLTDVTMDLTNCNGSPIEIAAGKTAVLEISGNNSVSAYAAGPGILVNQNAALTIRETSSDSSLTVEGAQMQKYSDQGGISGGMMSGFAGIGGPNSNSELTYTGTINIESGTIRATGYGYGAAIGGGDYSSGGTISISGGNVTAINGGDDPAGWQSSTLKQASGIGASQGQASGKITISGNAVVAAYGGYACAGIGGGTTDVTISDQAQVTAYGGKLAAGIGGYNKNKGSSTIKIQDNSTVTAYGGESASGIGQGSATSSVNIEIGANASVLAYSDGTKAAITGTPTNDSAASVLNLYLNSNITGLPAMDLPLYLNGNQGVTIPSGYRGVGTTQAEGTYTVTIPLGGTVSYQLIADDAFLFDSTTDLTAYKVNLLQWNDGTATFVSGGTDIAPAEGTQLSIEKDKLIVPAGSQVTKNAVTEIWMLGGYVSPNGTLHPNMDDNFALAQDLEAEMSILPGGSATLEVRVEQPQDGGSLSYQWYKNGEPLDGETDADLVLENVTVDDFASYYVKVTKTLSGETQTLDSSTCEVKDGTISVTDITLEQTELTLTVGDTKTLTAVVAPENATNPAIRWTSSDDTVATVDENGAVVAVGAGTATITATTEDGGKTAECLVTVKEKLADYTAVEEAKQKVPADLSIYTEESVQALQDALAQVQEGLTIDQQETVNQWAKDITDAIDGLELKSTDPDPDKPCDGGDNCPSKPYQDVNTSSWYHESVDFVIKNSYMIGISSDPILFGTNDALTRAQAVQTLYQMEGKPAYTKAASYSDVGANKWYTNAISWASENGIVAGRDDGTFAPNEKVTRQDLVAIMHRYVEKYKGLSVETDAEIPERFTDRASVSAYAETAMAWAIDRGIINGITETILEPRTSTRRCEMARIIATLCDVCDDIP